jgi:predicted RNA-binding Zn ribbon-like protein
MRINEDIVDILESAEDVFAWLKRAEVLVPATDCTPISEPLLNSARRLRESIRELVEKRKAGEKGDPLVLNTFLAESQSYPQLIWSKANRLTMERVRAQETFESILAPIAEVAADLLTTADFRLIKRCEDESCVFWFYDLTKSHRRRWCSMELCGNRHKVASYRARRRGLNGF